MRRELFAVVVACAILALSGAAQAVVITYNFPIDGGQQVPPVATPGAGVGVVTLDTVTGQLDWNIQFAGLLANEVAAHFHGAALPSQNAGVQVPLPLGSPKIGQANLNAGQNADVQAGLWYVNIHSAQFPGGEIRGQVTPEPATMSLLAVGLAMPLLRRRRKTRRA